MANSIRSSFSLCSFNCRSIIRSIDDVRKLCTFTDVIALQETWLFNWNLSLLNTISDEFAYTGTSAVDTSAGMLRGRPYGGTALLWRKKLFPTTSVIQCDNPRISAIKLTSSDKEILVFSVYMPNNSVDNLPEFVQCVSTINALIVNESAVETVFVLGDFNAHPGELFSNELLSFCEEHNWICADLDKLGIVSGTFTYLSDAHGCKRWLDHCLTTKAGFQSVLDVYVKYGVFCSDHYPLIIECNISVVKSKLCDYNLKPGSKQIVRGERTHIEVDKYTNKCNELLKLIDFPADLVAYCDHSCNNSDHVVILDDLYHKITNALSEASLQSKEVTCSSRSSRVIGWNKHVSQAHREARLCFQNWVSCGKPNTGRTFDAMCTSRKIFKSRLRWVQNHQEQIKMDLLASHHSKNNFSSF